MAKDSRKVSGDEAVCADEATSLETLIRRRARGLIDAIVDEELEAALGAAESARVGVARQGYRHGTPRADVDDESGADDLRDAARPRARRWRARLPNGGAQLVPRYQRRSEQVDEAILGVYLSGTNTRRIKGALAPLLRGGPLSKDAVSRLVGRLTEDFETWRRPRSRRRPDSVPDHGRLVSEGSHWEASRTCPGPGDAGRARRWRARGAWMSVWLAMKVPRPGAT